MGPRSSSASPPRNAFPTFANGDVEVVLTPVQRLRLHSDVLRGASSKLSELLPVNKAAVLSKKALSEGVNIRYRLELVDVSTTLGENVGRLTMIKLDTHGRPNPAPGTPRATMALSSYGVDPASRAILAAWFSALGALYGREMHLLTQPTRAAARKNKNNNNNNNTDTYDEGYSDDDDDDDDVIENTAAGGLGLGLHTTCTTPDLGDMIAAAATMLDVMDYLELPGSMLAPVELALLGAEQTLWQSVCAAPLAWVELGARLRSFAIWREAALHVVGGWGCGEWTEDERRGLGGEVRALCERKAEKFEAWKEGLEGRLLAYRHERLRWEDGGWERARGKKEHEPDVFYWQAQCLWGQWLAARFREGEGRRAPDGGLALYRMIWEGRFCDAVTEQAKLAPLTPSGRKVVSEIVDEMKKDLKKMVEGAMISKLKLDQSKMPSNRMTPFTIELRNAPWNKQDVGERGFSHRRKRPRLASESRYVADEDDELEDHIA
ncbi:uncharacterized protein BKCO1_19000167 [Diplodia corticola]|uniref:Uncharacterized protein n=1 Tax=Diplodia corticola TaxID=236234 RepID=A0A1J9S3G4_9PEZI|nr:uncharacterized protein BKCO1_19000167 [Diplodia corticola]OJD35095.1 hypothetical protein BKCO1_19000167 [Diplodia corticola]